MRSEDRPDNIDCALLLLRGAGLVLFFTFGLQKSEWLIQFLKSDQPWDKVPLAGLIKSVGFPFSAFLALFAILCESIFSLLVVLGIGTRIFSILIAVSMIGALYTSIYIKDPVISQGSAIQYILMFGALAITGAGKYSAGYYIRTRKK
jgi:putative oxidoreductase